MIDVRKLPSPDLVRDLKRSYLATLTAPLDGMWESGFIPLALHWEVRYQGERAGYFCVDEEGRLLQFHVVEALASRAQEMFSHMLAQDGISGAIVSTVEPAYLSLCLDVHRKVRVHTYLYQDADRSEPNPASFPGASFDVVTSSDLAAVEAMQRQSLDADLGDWLTGYLRNLVQRGELFALRRDGELLGTGECRVSETQPSYSDLGMIVARTHRRQGLASHILRRLKAQCYRRGLEPICSTTVENIGAQKAIVRAGFVSRHRILEVSF